MTFSKTGRAETRTESNASCLLCSQELAHCHGIAIVHRDRHLECSDDTCTLALELHRFVLACVELDEACCRS